MVAVLCTLLLTYVDGSAVYYSPMLMAVLLTYVDGSAVYYSPMLVAVLCSVYYSPMLVSVLFTTHLCWWQCQVWRRPCQASCWPSRCSGQCCSTCHHLHKSSVTCHKRREIVDYHSTEICYSFRLPNYPVRCKTAIIRSVWRENLKTLRMLVTKWFDSRALPRLLESILSEMGVYFSLTPASRFFLFLASPTSGMFCHSSGDTCRDRTEWKSISNRMGAFVTGPGSDIMPYRPEVNFSNWNHFVL